MGYWIGEFIRTACVYFFVLFLWPSVVFYGHLRRHSRTYGFAFCTLGMVLLINMAVLGMGLIPRGLNEWIVRILFYGVFLIRLVQLTGRQREAALRDLERLNRGTIGGKSFRGQVLRLPGRAATCLGRGLRTLTKGHVWTCTGLGALCLYSVLYFSWGAFDLRSFPFGDVYVHQAWITGLIEGKIFSAGIYPEGMHAFIYLLHAVSGVSVYSLLLFTGSIHTAVLMVSVWLFLREIFHWEGTPLLVLLLFLILDQRSVNDLYMMSRLQGTIPQEFAMYAGFLCGAFLLRYLKHPVREAAPSLPPDGTKRSESRPCRAGWKKSRSAGVGPAEKPARRLLWSALSEDENLRLFGLAVSVTFAVHFYLTIMAVFLCLAIALPMLRKLMCRGGIMTVIRVSVLAVLIALAPMTAAFAEGYPLQGSLGWAMNVMQGKVSDDTVRNGDSDAESAEEPAGLAETTAAETAEASDAVAETVSAQEEPGRDSFGAAEDGTGSRLMLVRPMTASAARLAGKLSRAVRTVRQKGFETLYPGRTGAAYFAAVLLALILPLLLRLLSGFLPALQRFRGTADGYLIPALGALFFLADFLAPSFGLPQVISGVRVLTMLKFLLLASCGMLPDLLAHGILTFLNRGRGGRARAATGRILLLAGGIACCALVTGSGHYHGYLYSMMRRYPAAVDVTNEIIRKMPKNSYTVISTTEELYQVVHHGYHEELLTLVKMEEMYPGYTLPSRYLFVYVEKKPLYYDQMYFPKGPGWLAVNGRNYRLARHSRLTASQSPDFAASVITESDADKSLDYQIGSSKAAESKKGRKVLEAKAARWIESFRKAYPNACRVWYEDNRFVCYQIVQDPQIPYKLGFTAEQFRQK